MGRFGSTFTATDIRRACAAIYHLQQKAGWRFASTAVLRFEFADRAALYGAHCELMSVLREELLPSGAAATERLLGDNASEIDCHGVTFRLQLKSPDIKVS